VLPLSVPMDTKNYVASEQSLKDLQPIIWPSRLWRGNQYFGRTY